MQTKIRYTWRTVTAPQPTETCKHVTILRKSEPTDMFYLEDGICSDSGLKVKFITNPLRMLLNQKRLDDLLDIGIDNAQKWYDTLISNSQTPDSLRELTKDLSADELRTMIRSKYIQSYSQLNNWCKYMSNNLDAFKKEVDSVRIKLENEEKEKQSQSNNQGTT